MKILPLSALTLAAAVLATAPSHSQTIQVNPANRTIAITATDKVIVMADTATVHIGFIAYGPDSDAAYATGSRISNAIVKSLTSAGIPNDAIESENQNVSPVQEYQIDKLTPAEKAQRKFQVVQSWTVRTPPTTPQKPSTSPSKPEPTSPARSAGASKTRTPRRPKPPAKPSSAPAPWPTKWPKASTSSSAPSSTPATKPRPSRPAP
jgi:hypothetical protein